MRSRNFIGIPSFFLLVGTAKSKQNALTTSKPTSNLAKRILLKIISPFIRGQCFQTQQCRGCAVTSCTHCRVAPPGLALTPLLGGLSQRDGGALCSVSPAPGPGDSVAEAAGWPFPCHHSAFTCSSPRQQLRTGGCQSAPFQLAFCSPVLPSA